MKIFSALFFLFTLQCCFVQDTTLLICGPMLCNVSHREATIWVEPTSIVNSVQIKCWKKNEITSAKTFSYKGILGQDYNPLKVVLMNLDMNAEYNYEIYLNNKKQQFPFPLSFKTKGVWEYRTSPPAFSFIFGSCAYINVSVTGEKLLERIATITCYTADGKIPWTFEIRQQDLKW